MLLVVMTTPLGKRCSRMSRARRKATLNGGVSLLSGGAEKERRYTEGLGCVQIMPPGGAVGFFGSRAMGIEKRAGIGAMSSSEVVVEEVVVDEIEDDREESEYTLRMRRRVLVWTLKGVLLKLAALILYAGKVLTGFQRIRLIVLLSSGRRVWCIWS